MKTIDLNAILDKHTTGRINILGACIDAMKEACEQTVDLCAENAKLYTKGGVDVGHLLNKHSILNTKTQIKWKK